MATDLTCYKCGILFSVPDHWYKCRREDKENFWCPNGHSQAFVKSMADKLAEELSRAKQQLAQKDDEIQWQRQHREAAERSASAARGQVTRLKNRASAGVCPCCNRTFSQLARHMANKHPGFSAEPIEVSTVVPLKIAAKK